MDALKRRLIDYISRDNVTPLMVLGATTSYMMNHPDPRIAEMGRQLDLAIQGIRKKDTETTDGK